MNAANLFQAVYTRLAGYTALTSKVQGIYSKVPPTAAASDSADFPFVFFNLPSVDPFDTKTSDGAAAIFNVHVYSRSTSKLTRLAIEDEVYNCLHHFDLVVAGANTILCEYTGRTEFEDPDGITTHAVLAFRILYDDI